MLDYDVDVAYACDGAWWDKYVTRTRGERWTCDADAATRYGLRWIQGMPSDGLSPNRQTIRFGNNSGHQAINLAINLGARRVYALGLDCSAEPETKRKHYHPDHSDGLTNPHEQTFQRWRVAFARLAVDCAARGIEVINLSRRTALTCFPTMTVETALEHFASR